MKITKYITIVFVIILFISMSVKTQATKQKDVIVDNKDSKQLELALENGCTLSKQLRHISVLRCSQYLADTLGLQEDINIHSTDSQANSQIGADTVHSLGNTAVGGKVVVLDTGYNYNHPELVSSYLGGKDFVNSDDDPFDDNGHGSFVAGLITADGLDPNAKGVAPDAGIIAGKVLDFTGTGSLSNLIEGIYWAVNGPDGLPGTPDDFNAQAISISIGTDPPFTYADFCDSVFPSVASAVNYAVSKNIAVVSAAGNSGTSGVGVPGCVSSSITVGAINSKNKIYPNSGIGNALDVVAPGVDLLSTWLASDYRTYSGTSMATPIVSGTIALIKYQHSQYSVSQVRTALINTARDLGTRDFDTTFGYGKINADQAVSYIFSGSVVTPAPGGSPIFKKQNLNSI